jgi:DNA polymerase
LRSEERRASLDAIGAEVRACRNCRLAETRTRAVPGEGSADTEVVFVGEGPGFNEDQQGRPFVGRAGGVLNELLASIEWPRSDVFITNVVKCRPPGNRDPEPDEIAACEPFLKHQLALIKPKAIVTLGKFAAQCLLKTRTPITRLRGEWTQYQGIPLMPTFHPAYLLRNPSDKRLVWRDIQQVMSVLGLR